MVIYVSEAEMIERFVDGLKKASSKAVEFIKAPLEKRPAIYVEFIDGMKVAAGSAHQLAHAQENPIWLKLRDFIEKIIDLQLPTYAAVTNGLWVTVKQNLDAMIDKGQKMATARPKPRFEVLLDLDERKRKASEALQREGIH